MSPVAPPSPVAAAPAAPTPPANVAHPIVLANAGKPILTFQPDGTVTLGAGVKADDAVARQLLQALRVAYVDKEARQVAVDMRAVVEAYGRDLSTLGQMVEESRQKTVVGTYAVLGASALHAALLGVVFWRLRHNLLAKRGL